MFIYSSGCGCQNRLYASNQSSIIWDSFKHQQTTGHRPRKTGGHQLKEYTSSYRGNTQPTQLFGLWAFRFRVSFSRPSIQGISPKHPSPDFRLRAAAPELPSRASWSKSSTWQCHFARDPTTPQLPSAWCKPGSLSSHSSERNCGVGFWLRVVRITRCTTASCFRLAGRLLAEHPSDFPPRAKHFFTIPRREGICARGLIEASEHSFGLLFGTWSASEDSDEEETDKTLDGNISTVSPERFRFQKVHIGKFASPDTPLPSMETQNSQMDDGGGPVELDPKTRAPSASHTAIGSG